MKNIIDCIGNTPLIKLQNIVKPYNNVFVKAEFFNPTGSVKDRIAWSMIKNAFDKKLITKETVIIEPTSGNTGIGLASVCASLGMKLILTMPDTLSVERRKMLKYLGAELILTDGTKGMKGAIEKALEIREETTDSYIPMQFSNSSNPMAHYTGTAPEIWRDMDGKIDVFIAGVGTGGTISGCGEYFKEKNSEIKIIAVEPSASAVISGNKPGSHKIQGIGAGFIPEILNLKIIDKVIQVDDDKAYQTMSLLSEKEGIFCGISSGAAVWAALDLIQSEEYKYSNICVILPDSGSRYLSVI